MQNFIQNTLKEYINLIEQAEVNITVGNYNDIYDDNWLSIDYNGYQAKDIYRVKLYSLKVVLEQALKKRIVYFLDEEINGFEYSVLIDNQADLFPKKVNKSISNKSPITARLLVLKPLFSLEMGLYKHQNLNVKRNGTEIRRLDEYETQISDYIRITYDSLLNLLEIEDNYAKFRSFFNGSNKDKDNSIKIFNAILGKVGAVDNYGNCLLNNRNGKNNRAILWSIKDKFCDEGIFSVGLSDREFIQTLWKYMDGQEPIPEKRHENKYKEEHYQTVTKLFTEITA